MADQTNDGTDGLLEAMEGPAPDRFRAVKKGSRVIVHAMSKARVPLQLEGKVLAVEKGVATIEVYVPGQSEPKVWNSLRQLTPERLEHAGPLVDCYEPAPSPSEAMKGLPADF